MFRKTFGSVAPVLAALVVATPALAQPGAYRSDLAARTEAKGYLAISNGLAQRTSAPASADPAGSTEAKGYLAISKGLADRAAASTPATVVAAPDGFDWSAAGIGAAAGAGVVVFLLGATLLVRHGRAQPRPA